MNKEKLLEELNKRDISCNEETAYKLEAFMKHILMWNEKFNLTAIKDEEAFMEKMIFDSAIGLVDEGADVHYVEGCTAPTYSKESLHAAVVEIIVLKGGRCRYSTVQNWSTNIVNLVTKRAVCYENASMEWIDGNVGSQTNMKYPACVLKGEGAKGTCISIAVAGKNQYQDAGARMIHEASNTTSTIISKSIVKNGGVANYRGTVRHKPGANNCRSHVECDTLILDDISRSDTIPNNEVHNNTSYIEMQLMNITQNAPLILIEVIMT